jgi:hypothetical protein
MFIIILYMIYPSPGSPAPKKNIFLEIKKTFWENYSLCLVFLFFLQIYHPLQKHLTGK